MLVSVEEIGKEMSESEHASFLADLEESGYSNDAIKGENGEYVLTDAEALKTIQEFYKGAIKRNKSNDLS